MGEDRTWFLSSPGTRRVALAESRVGEAGSGLEGGVRVPGMTPMGREAAERLGGILQAMKHDTAMGCGSWLSCVAGTASEEAQAWLQHQEPAL